MAEYKVTFEVFEGPLDLLLYLIKKEEVDIYEVSLSKLATQFLEYLSLMRQLDLDVAGEFIVMAATLIYIKSRELLPVDQQAGLDGEEDGPDPRWELIRQLVAYKKFKDAAAQLQQLEHLQESVYPHQVAPLRDLEPPPMAGLRASLFDLLTALRQVLQRLAERQPPNEIVDDRWTVAGQMEHILRVLAERGRTTFAALFTPMQHRAEVVATFLALLELIRLQQVMAWQREEFGEIELVRRESPPLDAPGDGLAAAGPDLLAQPVTPGEPTAANP